METNYPRIEEGKTNWMSRFFWKNLGLSFFLCNLTWIFATIYFFRTGENPIEPKLDVDTYAESPESALSTIALALLVIQIVVNIILGIIVARQNQHIVKSIKMRVYLAFFQLFLVVIGWSIWAYISD